LIEKGKYTIHYHHWRANCIAKDLYLGEKRFLAFVKLCKINEVLLDVVWIEGCVIIDLDKKSLYFWSLEMGMNSAVNFYLDMLQKKWHEWSISILFNKMYDVEKILNIDYVSNQDAYKYPIGTEDDIANDELSEWLNSVVIIKTATYLHICLIGSLDVQNILTCGEKAIKVLLNKHQCELPKEDDEIIGGCLIIDIETKQIWISESEFSLWEQTEPKWPGYKLNMGDYGYIGTLKLANIDIENLAMPTDKIKEVFNDLIRQTSDFDPASMAKALLKEDKDIRFNPDFFDDVNPQKTLFERLKVSLYKKFKL